MTRVNLAASLARRRSQVTLSVAAPMTRREFVSQLSRTALGITTLAAAMPCLATVPGDQPLPASAFGLEVAAAWFDLALSLIQSTPGFSPPVASRALGYIGVTLYEALVPGMPGYRSLAGRLDDLGRSPEPADPACFWPAVANTALGSILSNMFPASAAGFPAIESLETSFAERFASIVPRGTLRRSIARGESVANFIFDWSKGDGGHEAYLHNFPAYTPPVGLGLWVPTPPGFLPALQPYWGTNRPFAVSPESCDPGPPLTFSEDPSSPFRVEAEDCYAIATNLTPEEEAVARFWSDDPGATVTPPGHSISIATQVLGDLGASLDVAAETYAKVGIAIADAFIACWRTKYRHNLLRPVTYVRRLINPGWNPLLVTPPFPEYTSGHSVQSGASARVLTDLFGDVGFTDHTNDSRGLAPRSFGSFLEAAQEAASSRVYAGIHFETAVTRGLSQGELVGQVVSSLVFRDR